MGTWISGGLHNLIRSTSSCYKPTMVYKCRLCGLDADRSRHLEECQRCAGTGDNQIIISIRNINKIVYILRSCHLPCVTGLPYR